MPTAAARIRSTRKVSISEHLLFDRQEAYARPRKDALSLARLSCTKSTRISARRLDSRTFQLDIRFTGSPYIAALLG